MKFLVTKDWRQNPFLRSMLVAYFVVQFLFLILNIVYENFRYGLIPQTVREQVLGNIDLFIFPKDFVSLVTDIHINLFVYSFFLLTALSVFMHTQLKDEIKVFLLLIAFLGVIGDMVGLLATRYGHYAFAWLKVVAFWGFEISSLVIVFTVLNDLRRSFVKGDGDSSAARSL